MDSLSNAIMELAQLGWSVTFSPEHLDNVDVRVEREVFEERQVMSIACSRRDIESGAIDLLAMEVNRMLHLVKRSA